MRFGERMALEGLLSFLRPRLAVEIGTAQGGSLRRIAAHAEAVHAFDIVDPGGLRHELPEVEFHVGDSGEKLPAVLAQLHAEGDHVDFALVDGDHTADGVRRDAQALLDSPACRSTVIVFHDAANEEVRAGLEALDLPEHPKVAVVLWDLVPGYLVSADARHLEIWNGLALVTLYEGWPGRAVVEEEFYDSAWALQAAREAIRSGAPG